MSVRNTVRLRQSTGLLLVLPLAMACASGSSSSSDSTPSRDRNVITQEEVAELPPQDAYQVVQRLRPRWLRQRGTGGTAQVRIDGRLIQGGVTALRTLRAAEIREIRYIDARDATTQFGTGFTGGLIDVTTKG